MKERYDAVLVHGYTDPEGHTGNFGYRNKMQFISTVDLFKAGEIDSVFIAGGQYWGENNTPFGEVMRKKLIRKGINENAIIIRPETTTTKAEIDLFLEEAEKRNWSKLASLSNKTHTPRVQNEYGKKPEVQADQIQAESVLYNIRHNNRYPYRKFLDRFARWENVFKLREKVARTLQIPILEGPAQSFSDSKIGQFIKSWIDK